jgi:excisionase family DNA binding protein
MSIMSTAIGDGEKPHKPQVLPLVASVMETQVMLNISERTVYKLIEVGQLRSTKIGKKRMVLLDSIHSLLAKGTAR